MKCKPKRLYKFGENELRDSRNQIYTLEKNGQDKNKKIITPVNSIKYPSTIRMPFFPIAEIMVPENTRPMPIGEGYANHEIDLKGISAILGMNIAGLEEICNAFDGKELNLPQRKKIDEFKFLYYKIDLPAFWLKYDFEEEDKNNLRFVKHFLLNESFQFYFLDTRFCFDGEPENVLFSHVSYQNNLYLQLGFFNGK